MIRPGRRDTLQLQGNVFDSFDLPTQPTLFNDRSLKVKLNVEGPYDNLSRVQLDSPNGLFDIKSLAPEGSNFRLSAGTDYTPLVYTDHVNKELRINARNIHPDELIYALLHGISRLQKYEDPVYHESSAQMHKQFNEKCRNEELNSGHLFRIRPSNDLYGVYRFLCNEEKLVTQGALEFVRRLVSEGINPIPHIFAMNQLTKIVNSKHIGRTMSQFLMDRDRFYYHTGHSMYLEESEVRSIMNGYPPNIPVPIR